MAKMALMYVSTRLITMKKSIKVLALIVLSCLILSYMMFSTKLNHWFSLMIVLMYVSGVMVMFMFVVSLAANEKTPLKKPKKAMLFLLANFFLFFYKPLMSSENTKVNTMFKYSMLPMALSTLIILLMAYIPPKMIKSLHKGMKTSK